ncbi:MAG: S8 family peptidase [Alphaproteobacteria bacterium]
MNKNKILFAGLIILTGCGGGGGGKTSLSLTSVGSSLYSAQKTVGLTLSDPNVNTVTGKNVKVGVIENGLFLKNDEQLKGRYGTGIGIDGRAFSGHTDNSYGRKTGGSYNDDVAHAMAVATVVAGKDYGIARGATIIPYMTVNTTGAPQTRTADYYDTYQDAKSQGVVALNASWGHDDKSSHKDYRTKAGVKYFLGRSLVNQLVAYNDAYERDNTHVSKNYAIWVFSTGNTSSSDRTSAKKAEWTRDVGYAKGDNPHLEGQAGYIEPKLKRFMLAVAGVDANGREWSGTNRCGVAKDYCLAAQSKDVQSRWLNNGTAENKNVNGTSFAAPAVSGGIAMLKEKFGTSLTIQEIRSRLLTTARHELKDGTELTDRNGDEVKTDSDGLSKEFGHGVMRLDLALKPVGPSSTAFGTNLKNSKKTATYNSKLKTSLAFESGFKTGLSSVKTTVFDSLDAPFSVNMNSHVIDNPTYTYDRISTSIFNRNYTNSVKLSSNSNYQVQANHSSVEKMGFGFVKSSSIESLLVRSMKYQYEFDNLLIENTMAMSGDMILTGLKYNYKIGGGTITPTMKVLYEKGRVLGASGKGTFASTGNSATVFIGSSFTKKINKLNLYGFFNYGKTINRGFYSNTIKEVGNVYSREYGLYASYDYDLKNKMGFGFVAPLRVDDAPMTVVYNKGRDYSKNLSYATKQINASPTGRQIDIEMFYEKQLTKTNSTIRFSTLYSRDKNHTKGDNEMIVGINLTTRF